MNCHEIHFLDYDSNYYVIFDNFYNNLYKVKENQNLNPGFYNLTNTLAGCLQIGQIKSSGNGSPS